MQKTLIPWANTEEGKEAIQKVIDIHVLLFVKSYG